MEWHLFHTILASFLAVFGFVLDLQSFIGGLSFWRRGSGPRPLLVWPLVFYIAAAFTCDGSINFKIGALAAGLAVHLISSGGVRWLGLVCRRSASFRPKH